MLNTQCSRPKLTLVALGLFVGDLHLTQATAGGVDEEEGGAGLLHARDARQVSENGPGGR